MSKLSYVSTPTSVAVRFPSGQFKQLLKEHPLFGRLMDALKAFKFELVEDIFDQASLIKRHSAGQFWLNEANLIVHKGEVMPDSLSRRILAFCEQDIDTSSLVKFWENLCQNPSLESRKHLYGFMEHNDIPITEDGCFMAYKYVNSDWWDTYTGNTHKNTVGSVVEMDREKVDSNPHQTCSSGLHVCAWGYLGGNSWDTSHKRRVEVKVNPADVVAVPIEYKNEKMRVCRYTVLREINPEKNEGQRFEQLYPKFKEGQRVEVELENGDIEVGTIDEIITSPTEQNSYIVTLDSGNRPTVKENKIVLFDLSENADDDEDFEDEDYDEDDYEIDEDDVEDIIEDEDDEEDE